MIIKHPNDDNAIRRLIQILNSLNRIQLSSSSNNNVLLIYMSTLLITPGVKYKDTRTHTDIKLLDVLKNILTRSPRNTVCVFRTTAPSYFKGNMKNLQQIALNSLRDKCYVKVYDRNMFLNHAKFIVYYYFPSGFMKTMRFRTGRYFGSTNFTAAGLSSNSGTKKGNYEEFTTWERMGSISHYQEFKRCEYYITEIIETITENYKLYTDKTYLRKYLNRHTEYLRKITVSVDDISYNTTLGKLYESYVNCQVAYLQTLALIDTIPGKNLTREIILKLKEAMSPPTPFEIEMMMPYDDKHAQKLAKILEFSKNQLILQIKDYISIINDSIKLLNEDYKKRVPIIREYFDEKEIKLMRFLSENTKTHITFLKTLIKLIKKLSKA